MFNFAEKWKRKTKKPNCCEKGIYVIRSTTLCGLFKGAISAMGIASVPIL